MSTVQAVFPNSRTSFLLALLFLLSAMAVVLDLKANTKHKPAEVPAQVIAHLPLTGTTSSGMFLQKEDKKQYLYIQQASNQGYIIVDVSRPESPSLVKREAASDDATAGKMELVGPNVAVAEVPNKNDKAPIRSTSSATETVKILDLSDPAHPKTLQTFKNVTGMLPDGGRGLLYLTNDEGLWVLKYNREGITPEKKKRPCTSGDAIAAMPPDCE